MKSIKRTLFGYIAGVCTIAFTVLIGLAASSKLILDGIIRIAASESVISGILIVAALLGNMITIRLSGGKPFIITCIYVSVIAILLLLCGLIIDGQFQNVAIILCSVAAGAAVSYILSQRNIGKAKKKKRRYR